MKQIKKSSRLRITVFLILALLVIVYPLALQKNPYAIRLGILCLMYASLALSLNLVTGFMGQVSLGHAAFMGIGAYTSALLAKNFDMPFLITVLCAIVLSALFGMILTIPAMKLSGSYLAIVTLGVCEIVRLIELNWVSLTRGPMGITGIPRPKIFGLEIRGMSYYYLALALLLLSYCIIQNLIRSCYGRGILSVREDVVAAQAMGVDIVKFKLIAFAISSGLTGMMGAFYAHYMRFIDPIAFDFDQSAGILTMVILGGSGSLPGSLIGAVLMTLIPEALRGFSEIRLMLYGLVLTIVVILRPAGILGKTSLAQLLGIEKKYTKPGMSIGLEDMKKSVFAAGKEGTS
jgi:branched-chain amino acid transport system permease protein